MPGKRIIPIVIFVGALFVLGTANAQPAPAPMPAPAAMPAPMPAPMPVAKPAPKPAAPVVMTVAAPAMPAAPVAAPAMEAPAPVAAPAPTMEPEMAAEPAMAVAATPEKPKTETPVWKTAGFWIGVVGGPLFSIVLAILVAFGVIRKKWLTYLREKEIVKIADKVVTNIEAYAQGTEAKWDDVVAQALKAVVTRVGELTEEEKKVVESVVKDREAQAKTNNGGE